MPATGVDANDRAFHLIHFDVSAARIDVDLVAANVLEHDMSATRIDQ
jgi:hypothetical protein